MLTQDGAIDTVRNYAREIEAFGIRLQKVFLFGSFAKGTQHEWSDIDVALVADEFDGLPHDMRLFPRIGSKKSYVRIDALTYPTDYFLQSDPFIEEIKKTGIVIK
ncbi:MAG: nucleotidyltransferase domain-containing protein [Prevotellaceae bacterium]|jgi:predicted nucleotidyltransferase|nr:nucleotidyltransferase domain-containing protein [Prevotellaceae bacterium]